MSASKKAVKNTTSATVPNDIDDDYSSIVSEQDLEEKSDVTDALRNAASADEEEGKSIGDSLKTAAQTKKQSKSGKKRNKKRSNASKVLEFDQPNDPETKEIITPTNASAELEDQSIMSTFYILDESDTEQQQQNSKKSSQTNSSDDQEDRFQVSSTPEKLGNFPASQQQNESNTAPTSPVNVAFTARPISNLNNDGYELLNIKLMQASETIAIGFKLTKQLDPPQFIMTKIVEGSRADTAGLQVKDWLIKVEEQDIRSSDLYDVSQRIQEVSSTVGFVNILIARKSNDTPSAKISNERTDETEDDNQQFVDQRNILMQLDLVTKDKTRIVTLNEAAGLYFNSFVPDPNKPIQIHYVKSIQPISNAYRAGLRNNDRILAVNGVDVIDTSHDAVRLMILKTKPVDLTVINDPKYLNFIENFKRDQNQITSSSLNHAVKEQTVQNDLSENLINILFVDDNGPVYFKHCLVRRQPSQKALGFQLQYINNQHVVDVVEYNLPGHLSGLRNHDVILFINKTNVERSAHDEVKILLKSAVTSDEAIDLMLVSLNDLPRYKTYQKISFIDWKSILEENHEDNLDNIKTYANHHLNTLREIPTPSLLAGARICVMETVTSRSAGFTIGGGGQPPFAICKVDKDSPAEKAGLQLDDLLLSINGKSLIETSYEDTIQTVKESLQQAFVQVVVNQRHLTKGNRIKRGSQSSSSDDGDLGSGSEDSTEEPDHNHRAGNAIHLYQKQRMKELSYSVRICHLNAINSDGAPVKTFGFEISHETDYEQPIVSRVEPKLAADRVGLQTGDVLIKLNGRKTKGLEIEKVRKSIEKSKRDGRLELLVTDKETFEYCQQTNKKFKEPYIKVKHIFPRSRSSASFQRLPSLSALASSSTSQDTRGRLQSGTPMSLNLLPISKEIQFENEEDDSVLPSSAPPIDYDMLSPTSPPGDITELFFPYQRPSTLTNKTNSFAEEKSPSPTSRDGPDRLQNRTSIEESMMDSVLNAIKDATRDSPTKDTIELNYDVPKNGSNTQASAPSTIQLDGNVLKRNRPISQLRGKIPSHQPSESYDYIGDARRCILPIDRAKGLGFVLSAVDDYDHTITTVTANSIADSAGLQIDDEIVEINGNDVRAVKYEKVVNMLILAIQTSNAIEMCVVNGRINKIYTPTIDGNIHKNVSSLSINQNNTQLPTDTVHRYTHMNDDLSDRSSSISVLHRLNRHGQSNHFTAIANRGLSGSVLTLSTGITASPKNNHWSKTTSASAKRDSCSKILDIHIQNAPIARLCRIRKFPSSPFYGFFLSGDSKRLGRVFVSNVTKNSSVAICGLRTGDYIIEVNGINIQALTYQTILDQIQLHMERHDLELLVLDKKALRWYHDRNYPTTSRTLPTIIHIEPLINSVISEQLQAPRAFDTQTNTITLTNEQELMTNL